MERLPVFMYWKSQHCENGYLTKSNLHIQYNLYQNVKTTFHSTTETVSGFLWKQKRTQASKAILSKSYNARDITIPDFKIYYRAIVISSMLLSLKPTVDQQNKTEDPHMSTHSYR